MNYGVGTIAHSCGVTEPRKLERHHAELINELGVPTPMTDYYPNHEIQEQYLNFMKDII